MLAWGCKPKLVIAEVDWLLPSFWLVVLTFGQLLPCGNDGVGVERDGADAFLRQPFGKVGVVAGALAADAYVFALRFAGGYGACEQGFYGGVAFVKVGSE